MTMDLDQAIRTLEDLRRNDPVIQRGRNAELTTAFKVFWDSNPDEAKFCRLTAGLLITPAILYHMVTHPIGMITAHANMEVISKEGDTIAEAKLNSVTVDSPAAGSPKVMKNAERSFKGGKNAAPK
jgi:hypothetical protein